MILFSSSLLPCGRRFFFFRAVFVSAPVPWTTPPPDRPKFPLKFNSCLFSLKVFSLNLGCFLVVFEAQGRSRNPVGLQGCRGSHEMVPEAQTRTLLDRPPLNRPEFCLFFPSPAPNFVLFFCLCQISSFSPSPGFSLNFGGALETQGPQTCTFGVLWAILCESLKEKNLCGVKEKSARNVAPRRAPHLVGLSPLGAHLLLPPFWPSLFQVRARLGPPPFRPPPFEAPSFLAPPSFARSLALPSKALPRNKIQQLV